MDGKIQRAELAQKESPQMTSTIRWQTAAVPQPSNTPRGPAAASEASFQSASSHPEKTHLFFAAVVFVPL